MSSCWSRVVLINEKESFGFTKGWLSNERMMKFSCIQDFKRYRGRFKKLFELYFMFVRENLNLHLVCSCDAMKWRLESFHNKQLYQ